MKNDLSLMRYYLVLAAQSERILSASEFVYNVV